jgi:uncharacterized protein (TIGR03083 family)
VTLSDDEVRALLATTAAQHPPTELGVAVTAAALAARPSGLAVDSLGGGRPADPRHAYRQTVTELRAALAGVDGHEIISPYGWSLSQLVAHLLEIDRYFGRQLGLWDHAIDTAHEDDHLAMTAAAVEAAAGASFAGLLAEWDDVWPRITAHVDSLGSEELRTRMKFHLLETRLSTILVVRVFELWTHTEDVCRAMNRRAPSLDAGRLHLMTNAAVAAIPLGMLLAGIDGGRRTARIVLTGHGGGAWNQSLQFRGEAGEPDVTIVADAIDFCRLAAQRIAPGDLDADVEGSIDLAVDVLRGASVFAA